MISKKSELYKDKLNTLNTQITGQKLALKNLSENDPHRPNIIERIKKLTTEKANLTAIHNGTKKNV